MKVYHGSQKMDMTIKSQYPSRYKFTALFCSRNKQLATAFARHNRGMLYELDIMHPDVSIDFQYNDTYSPVFVNIIRDFQKLGVPALIIRNAVDKPHKSYPQAYKDDIIVIYDTGIIKTIRKI